VGPVLWVGDGGFDYAQEVVTLYGQGVHRAFIRF